MNSDNGHTLWPDVQNGLGQVGAADDFASFLELGDFDSLDLSAFNVDSSLQAGESTVNSTFKAGLDRAQQMQLHQDAAMGYAQAHLRQYQNGGYGGHGGYIPPTPNSLEMQAGNRVQYTDHTPFMDCYQSSKEDQMSFTPLVSPAVMPYDNSFMHVPEFTMPTPHFSPLNSPALEAYNGGRSNMYSNSTSPIEPKGSPAMKKSQRRKSGSVRNPARVVRESPSMKPQRGRKAPPPLLATPELVDAAANVSPNTQARKHAYIHMSGTSSRDNSSTDSISPEPLTEALMPPPPAPSTKSSLRSPYLIPSNGDMDIEARPLRNGSSNVAPATPASLMNLSKQTPTIPEERTIPGFLTNDQIVSNFVIGKSGDASSPIMIDTDTDNQPPRADDGQSTPTMTSVRMSSKDRPVLSRSSSTDAATKLATASATNGSSSKPNSGSLTKRHGRTASTSSHTKRGSISMSPALQPRQSPNIKPLLPEGMSSSASAIMLASKSNYENIVSGNHNQLGLSYPAHISTNLTSKRTSHKIAEQGRRNRINNGLTVLHSLLPPKLPTGSGNTSEGGGSATAADQANSKALTVEMAIDYIKELQRQLGEMKIKVGTLELELAGCKEKEMTTTTAEVLSATKTEVVEDVSLRRAQF